MLQEKLINTFLYYFVVKMPLFVIVDNYTKNKRKPILEPNKGLGLDPQYKDQGILLDQDYNLIF